MVISFIGIFHFYHLVFRYEYSLLFLVNIKRAMLWLITKGQVEEGGGVELGLPAIDVAGKKALLRRPGLLHEQGAAVIGVK